MNNRIQLLIVLKYIMEKSAESEPVSNADILSYLASKNIKPCKMTLIEDLKVIKKAGYDLITIKKGKNNYYYIPSEHFDTTEARLITDSLISAKFVTPSTTERLLSKVMRLTDKEMEQHFINDIVLDFRLKHRNCNTTYSINVIQEALSVTGLARKSGLSFNSIVRYRAGHIPNDYIIVVMLCIGLKINISKAEYLFRLAHFSLGTDKCSLVYRLLINLSFVSDITIEDCNDFLVQNGFPSLKTTSNFMKGEKTWNQN